MEFVLGHGTENDFVVLPDPDGRLDLDDGALVRALCHRRRGLGADGVLRVVRAEAPAATAALTAVGVDADGAAWFMDYRNADGSTAEMCGNGIRVFARHLVDEGLVAPGRFPVATRAGARTVELGASGDVSVDMGPAALGPESWAGVGPRRLAGLAVDVGNPHLACVLPVGEAAALDGLDLGPAPAHDPVLFPRGVNVEVLTPLDGDTTRMRVHERGSGETRSCGTGTVAAAVAALRASGADEGSVAVLTPGGAVRVAVTASTTFLTGPAVLVARGSVDPAALAVPVPVG